MKKLMLLLLLCSIVQLLSAQIDLIGTIKYSKSIYWDETTEEWGDETNWKEQPTSFLWGLDEKQKKTALHDTVAHTGGVYILSNIKLCDRNDCKELISADGCFPKLNDKFKIQVMTSAINEYLCEVIFTYEKKYMIKFIVQLDTSHFPYTKKSE